jgi:SAM-dependent methyltransferase
MIMDTPTAASMPLRLGASGDFAICRDFLRECAFTESAICAWLKLDDLSSLGKVKWEGLDPGAVEPRAWAALQLFLRGETYPRAEFVANAGEGALGAFASLGLLRSSRVNPEHLLCPVWLYPVDGFWVVSDRPVNPEESRDTTADDVVFPAIYAGTLRFLRILPDAKGGDALDLCGGTGIGALHLSRAARSVATADLTKRSALFAEFNGRLNGVAVESLEGDLFGPVGGRTFDLITGHPPFVPATGTTMIYRDAGEAGEDVTRRMIEETPKHLRPGGTCVVLCVARDTHEAPIEERVRDWLGESHADFDILYGQEKILTVEAVVESMARRGQNLSPDAAQSLLERLRSLGSRQFVYGAIFIRRLRAPHNLPPFRFRISPEADASEFERLFAWREETRKPGFQEWLTNFAPRLNSRVQLTARHVVHEGELVPGEFIFSIDAGLQAAFRPDGWVVPLLARLNGTRTVKEVFLSAQAADELPEGFRLEDFAGLVRQMLERGFYDFPG